MSEDLRSPDQDAAMEAAFVAGTLPEEDRRAIEDAALADAVAEAADVYEWIQRGDGAHILYKNGSVCHDQTEREYPAV